MNLIVRNRFLVLDIKIPFSKRMEFLHFKDSNKLETNKKNLIIDFA